MKERIIEGGLVNTTIGGQLVCPPRNRSLEVVEASALLVATGAVPTPTCLTPRPAACSSTSTGMS
jgi:hypothetical protein